MVKYTKRVKDMKTTLKAITIFAAILAVTSISATSSETESRLLEQALVEGAVTPGQKTAVAKYFSNIALAKKQEAERYREMAKVATGGKFRAQAIKSRDMLQKADLLDQQAEYYQNISVAQNPVEEYKKLALK